MRDAVQYLDTAADLVVFWRQLEDLGIAAEEPVAIAG
jgi:hypothetical protein